MTTNYVFKGGVIHEMTNKITTDYEKLQSNENIQYMFSFDILNMKSKEGKHEFLFY